MLAGIEKLVHARGIRHMHAAQLRTEDIDVGLISKQIGHSNITTTERYLDHAAPRAVIEVMRTRTWIGVYAKAVLLFLDMPPSKPIS